jgi:hypothetical protein
MGDRADDDVRFKPSFGRWNRKPGGSHQGGKAEAPQSVRPQGAGKVPKQRPQKRGRKNGVKNGNAAAAGERGQAEATGMTGRR